MPGVISLLLVALALPFAILAVVALFALLTSNSTLLKIFGQENADSRKCLFVFAETGSLALGLLLASQNEGIKAANLMLYGFIASDIFTGIRKLLEKQYGEGTSYLCFAAALGVLVANSSDLGPTALATTLVLIAPRLYYAHKWYTAKEKRKGRRFNP